MPDKGYAGLIGLFSLIVRACDGNVDKAIEFARSPFGGFEEIEIKRVLYRKKVHKARYIERDT